MASLRLVPPSGTPIEIGQDQVLVGRETTCDVVVNDGSVSRKHARLEKRGRSWMVVDQGSANGTFVDSQRIAETQLRTGQELRFGAMKFRVEIEGDEVIGATMLTDAADATVVQAAPAPPPPAPPSRPPAPVPSSRPPAAAPPAPPPPLPPRPVAAVPPTGSLPPAALPPRVSAPPRPATPGSRPPARASMPPVPAPGEGAAPPRKGKGPLFWVAAGCCGCLLLSVLLSAVIGGFVYNMTSGAVEAVRTQLTDLKSGNLDAAYGRFTEDYKARVSREDFEVLVSQHPGLRENGDSTFWKRSVENTRGEISGILTSTSGTKEMVTYRLMKEGGTWKISDIEFAGQTSS